MREILLSDLVCDALGPRGGPRERLAESPLNEYVTGVLAPMNGAPAPDIDAEAALPTEDYLEETEETEEDDDVGLLPFAPVLDPQHRPFSMGLSFIVQAAEEDRALDLCITWARYQRDDGPPVTWIRSPRFSVRRRVPAPGVVLWLDAHGEPVPAQGAAAEISLHVRQIPVGKTRSLWSVHLVNRIAVTPDRHRTAEDHIYQPQIRVRCYQGGQIVSGLEGTPVDQEEQVLAFLYRDRPVLARGHLTSAVWRDIDPERERESEGVLDIPAAAGRPPFRWGDGELLDQPTRAHFTAPDARTEYVPLIAIPAPALGLREPYCAGVELKAEALAECWSPASLEAGLRPLVSGYRTWISELEAQRDVLPDGEREIATRLLGACRSAADRMAGGIRLLASDDDVRLAFCFAMRAMALQYSWSDTAARLEWHPFQLGFVLAALESIANPASVDRDVCDLLWVPTGGGKTEAYLALIAFALAYRRRKADRRRIARGSGDITGAGVGIISRYTLRLLTIQQFRRTLKVVTACELLRVRNVGSSPQVGWHPAGYSPTVAFLWGTSRFSCGLWVGSSVAPNRLQDSWADNRSIPGALTILRAGGDTGGEPAQMLRCPACNHVLALSNEGSEQVPPGGYHIHWVVRGGGTNAAAALVGLTQNGVTIGDARYSALPAAGFGVLSVRFDGPGQLSAEDVDSIWVQAAQLLPGVGLVCARGSRPGYFFRSYDGSTRPYDFEVFCPSPACQLNELWAEGLPAGCVHGAAANVVAPFGGLAGVPRTADGLRLAHVNAPFSSAASQYLGTKVPIPALTVDEQVYHRCPSVVIATVDKFARPAFEPRAGAIFGNVDRHHCLHGFYREYVHGGDRTSPHPSPAGTAGNTRWVPVQALEPPDLILQDELHLIEGPLGSLVGLYETAVDALCRGVGGRRAKYIASTATVREAADQVQAVFERELKTFPPPGLLASDSFFVRFPDVHVLDDRAAGRVYAGLCAPGRGPLTPVLRIWARLLQTAFRYRAEPRIDSFWTLTGYFNAIRELAGARALYRQDIPERVDLLARLDAAVGVGPRPLAEERSQELSGRMESTQLPLVLDILNEQLGQDALFTTSMFGTGVDVPRLGLMVVNGQPKTTSSYIQATGRVGRRTGAIVATFLRATRPRDLNHYEFFSGYHLQIHRFVEPVTVMPFAPGALDRGIGPVGVFMLRNKRDTAIAWAREIHAPTMARVRASDRDVGDIAEELERRAGGQPSTRAPRPGTALRLGRSALDDWQGVAARNSTLEYVEYASTPTVPVVLGDAKHQHAQIEVVYENAPQSLREIEETCGFQTE